MSRIVVLESKETSHHASSLMEYFGDQMVIEPDWRPSTIAAHRPDLVITFSEGFCEKGLCIAEMARQQTGTLLIMDGIPEWRNTWTRATSTIKRPINQPVISHKVACLGLADTRIFESWGNVGKCEVVGAPRFDSLIRQGKSIRTKPILDRPLRLLVMTAKTPGFTPEEIEITTRSLANLRDYFVQKPEIQVVWRITGGLHQQLKVKNTFTEATGKELHDVLAQVDAVITTPSTAMLEAMLFGIPVALLDYHNCPHYIPAAWRITCQRQIAPTLDDLRHVPLNRMLYQDYCLHDALSCRTEASPRMIELIEKMIQIKNNQNTYNSEKLEFPHRILNLPENFVSWPSDQFDLETLYPHHSIFGRSDLVDMQLELETALGTVDLLKERVHILEHRLHRIPGYKLAARVSKSLQGVLT